MKKKTTIKKRLTKKQIEANKIQKELEIVCSWTTVSSDKTLRIYALNRKIFSVLAPLTLPFILPVLYLIKIKDILKGK